MSKLFTHAISALLIFLLGVLTTTSKSFASPAACLKLFSATTAIDPVSATIHPLSIEVRGVNVSGDRMEAVSAGLDLTPEMIEYYKTNKLSILSLGEGYSELVPALLQKGINIKGLDLWYHSSNLNDQNGHLGKAMENYQNLHAKNLIRGNALSIPFKAETLDVILSHRLANHLHIAEQLRMITESVRVLKIYGQARILLTPAKEPSKSDEVVFKTIKNFLTENYAAALQVDISRGLLVINKIASTQMFDQLVIPFDQNQIYENLPAGSALSQKMQEKRLMDDYKYAVALAKKAPENVHYAQEVRYLESQIKNFQKIELTERTPLANWWVKFKSRFSVGPDIKE